MIDRAMMTDRVRQQVLDYLLGALDDSETDVVKACLRSDPVYQKAMYLARGDMLRLSNLVRVGGMRREVVSPPRLAERTCEFLFDPARRLRVVLRSRVTPPPTGGLHSGSRLNWVDVGVAAAIFLIAGFLVLPAIHGAHFAIMADSPSADRPGYPIVNQGEIGQNVVSEDLHIESYSTAWPDNGNEGIHSYDDREFAPGLQCDDTMLASRN